MSKAKKRTDRLDENYERANAVLEKYYRRKEEYDHRRNVTLIINTLLLLVLAVVLIVGGSLVYANRQDLANGIEAVKKSANFAWPFAPKVTVANSETAAVASPQSDQCEALPNISINDKDLLQITKSPQKGHCYIIPDEFRTVWASEFSIDSERARLVQYILRQKSNSGLTEAQVDNAIKESTTSFILDLRSSQAQDSQSPAPTQVAVAPTEQPQPTAVQSPPVIAVPWPEKDRGFSLEEMLKIMTSHNIQTVVGGNQETASQEKMRRVMRYDLPNGSNDYVIFNITNSGLPETCLSSSVITLSLIDIGDPNARRMSVGDSFVFFLCQ